MHLDKVDDGVIKVIASVSVLHEAKSYEMQPSFFIYFLYGLQFGYNSCYQQIWFKGHGTEPESS